MQISLARPTQFKLIAKLGIDFFELVSQSQNLVFLGLSDLLQSLFEGLDLFYSI